MLFEAEDYHLPVCCLFTAQGLLKCRFVVRILLCTVLMNLKGACATLDQLLFCIVSNLKSKLEIVDFLAKCACYTLFMLCIY